MIEALEVARKGERAVVDKTFRGLFTRLALEVTIKVFPLFGLQPA
jgi:hypothetical protein